MDAIFSSCTLPKGSGKCPLGNVVSRLFERRIVLAFQRDFGKVPVSRLLARFTVAGNFNALPRSAGISPPNLLFDISKVSRDKFEKVAGMGPGKKGQEKKAFVSLQFFLGSIIILKKHNKIIWN